MKRNRTITVLMLCAPAFALAACAQPSGFAVHNIAMPSADDDHPAALRDVADVQPTTVGATLNAVFSFPEGDK